MLLEIYVIFENNYVYPDEIKLEKDKPRQFNILIN